MDIRINPPHLQPGPVGFAFICVWGVALAVRGLTQARLGSEPWWVGVALLAIVLPAFAFIDGGWLWIQREIDFSDGTIVVRRWIEVLAGRAGRAIPIDRETRSSITLENVRSLRIERLGRTETRLTLGYWEPRRIRALVDALQTHGVRLDQYWIGVYPPGI